MMRIPLAAVALALGALVVPAAPATGKANVTSKPFGKTPDGTAVELFTLTNAHGMEASIMSYGGIVVSLKVPDGRQARRRGAGLRLPRRLPGPTRRTSAPSSAATATASPRAASPSTATLHARPQQRRNALHGGTRGFDKYVWDARDVSTPAAPRVELHHVSKDGEEGYPGNLDVQVT